MSAVNTKAAAYSKAAKFRTECHSRVAQLRSDLVQAEIELERAERERNRTQRELLEEAQQY